MNKEEFKKASEEVWQKKFLEEPDYWVKPRRHRWDEWGSPVGLSIWTGLSLISIGIFIYLLHISGII